MTRLTAILIQYDPSAFATTHQRGSKHGIYIGGLEDRGDDDMRPRIYLTSEATYEDQAEAQKAADEVLAKARESFKEER